ncbi:hypothetical protein D918_09745 [Trichuris suis]|nr:hypothetical protein D918_09745 [Trichuris suis]
MNSSWLSTQEFRLLSPNSTCCSLSELTRTLTKRSLPKATEFILPNDALFNGRLDVPASRTGLVNGLKQVHSAISTLLNQQESLNGKANALADQADVYTHLLRSLNNSVSSSSSRTVDGVPCGDPNFSEIESVRAGCTKSIETKREQPQVPTLKSVSLSFVPSLSSAGSLPGLSGHSFEHPSSANQPEPQVTLKLSKEQEQRLEALRTSFRSSECSCFLEEPIASSSPNKVSGTCIRERCSDITLGHLPNVEMGCSPGTLSKVVITLPSCCKMSRSTQVNPGKVSCAIAAGNSSERTYDSPSTSKRENISPCRRDASVQVSWKTASASSCNVADEGFSEPTEMLSTSDRRETTDLLRKSPDPSVLNEVRNVKVTANAEVKSEARRAVASSEHEGKSSSTPVPSGGFRLSSKMPFVAGMSTSSSYSVYANAQELLHSVKLNDPSLFDFCSKVKAPISVHEFIVALTKYYEKEIDELCEDICTDLRIYDRVREEISVCENKQCRSDLLIRQKEITDRIVFTDFKVRRVQARLKAVQEEVRCLEKGRSIVSSSKTNAINGPNSWRRPTLASSAKSSDRRSPAKQQKSSNSAVLRDLKTIKELITKHSYARVYS